MEKPFVGYAMIVVIRLASEFTNPAGTMRFHDKQCNQAGDIAVEWHFQVHNNGAVVRFKLKDHYRHKRRSNPFDRALPGLNT